MRSGICQPRRTGRSSAGSGGAAGNQLRTADTTTAGSAHASVPQRALRRRLGANVSYEVTIEMWNRLANKADGEAIDALRLTGRGKTDGG